jgi:hypothetical protein
VPRLKDRALKRRIQAPEVRELLFAKEKGRSSIDPVTP